MKKYHKPFIEFSSLKDDVILASIIDVEVIENDDNFGDLSDWNS